MEGRENVLEAVRSRELESGESKLIVKGEGNRFRQLIAL